MVAQEEKQTVQDFEHNIAALEKRLDVQGERLRAALAREAAVRDVLVLHRDQTGTL